MPYKAKEEFTHYIKVHLYQERANSLSLIEKKYSVGGIGMPCLGELHCGGNHRTVCLPVCDREGQVPSRLNRNAVDGFHSEDKGGRRAAGRKFNHGQKDSVSTKLMATHSRAANTMQGDRDSHQERWLHRRPRDQTRRADSLSASADIHRRKVERLAETLRVPSRPPV